MQSFFRANKMADASKKRPTKISTQCEAFCAKLFTSIAEFPSQFYIFNTSNDFLLMDMVYHRLQDLLQGESVKMASSCVIRLFLAQPLDQVITTMAVLCLVPAINLLTVENSQTQVFTIKYNTNTTAAPSNSLSSY